MLEIYLRSFLIVFFLLSYSNLKRCWSLCSTLNLSRNAWVFTFFHIQFSTCGRWFLLNGRITTFWTKLKMCRLVFQCRSKKSAFWLPFQFERKAIGKVNSKFSCEDNHYPYQPTKGGGWPHLKSMYECTKKLKRKVVIQNEIMIHFDFPKPTINN
jgi:hypothetical protein